MRRNLEWFEGAPEKLEPGMYLRFKDSDGALFLVGHDCDVSEQELALVERWSWLVTPAELEWLEAMAATNAKSRGV